ncbi:MarR family transcriptional regulator [Sporolactobacillus sp. THM7-7]|nr:MarR family transcriptional regulator [Sporolactobacillus sp. THM7-7]
MKTFGLSSTLGRVLGIIYMNRHPMTLSELSEATGMSKTRMSQAVRELTELGLAEKVFVKGIRQDLYDVEHDYYQIFISLFSAAWSRTARKNRKSEKRIHSELTCLFEQDHLSEKEKRLVKSYIKESERRLDFFNWISRLIEFFESDEVFQHLPEQHKR